MCPGTPDRVKGLSWFHPPGEANGRWRRFGSRAVARADRHWSQISRREKHGWRGGLEERLGIDHFRRQSIMILKPAGAPWGVALPFPFLCWFSPPCGRTGQPPAIGRGDNRRRCVRIRMFGAQGRRCCAWDQGWRGGEVRGETSGLAGLRVRGDSPMLGAR